MLAAGVGLLVQRLDAHARHQRADVQSADLMSFSLEKATQQPAARSWRAAPSRPHSAPLGHLRGVDLELLGDLGDRLVVLHRRQGHFGLEPRRVVEARLLAHVYS